MKKQYLFIASLFAGLLTLQAQTVLRYETHAIRAGDNHPFIITNNVDEGPAGPNQVWDFSNLEAAKDLVSKMQQSVETVNYKDIPEANAVIEEFDNKFYFKVTEKMVEHYGVVGCNNYIVKLDQPWVKMTFPFTYGTKKEGEFSGISGTNANPTPIGGVYQIEGDAFGKLILPNGTIDKVLRQKTTITYTHGNCQYSNITYRWYCKDVRYPLLSIIKEVNANSSRVTRTAYYANAGAIEQKAKPAESIVKKASTNIDVEMTVYPNPYTESFDIELLLSDKANVALKIYDNAGKLVISEKEKTMEQGKQKITVLATENGLKPGLYYIKVYVNGAEYSATVAQIK
jgi:hypothetical protein